MLKARAALAAVLLLALTGCSSGDPNPKELEAGKKEAKKFFEAFSKSEASTESIWKLRDFRVLGGAGDPEVTRLASSPAKLRAKFKIWCKGWDATGHEVKRERTAVLDVALVAGAWSLKKAGFENDKPLPGWAQFGWAIGRSALLGLLIFCVRASIAFPNGCSYVWWAPVIGMLTQTFSWILVVLDLLATFLAVSENVGARLLAAICFAIAVGWTFWSAYFTALPVVLAVVIAFIGWLAIVGLLFGAPKTSAAMVGAS